jgi:hypothetical protein
MTTLRTHVAVAAFAALCLPPSGRAQSDRPLLRLVDPDGIQLAAK